MPQANLSEALALLDWADRQIDVLSAEIARLSEAKPYAFETEQHPNGDTLFYLKATKSVTKLLGPSVKPIISAQRDSLDYIAVALAEANGAVDPTDVYFPIVKTAAAITEKPALKKIRRLHPSDQKIILDLKPYPGGNDTLFALHMLNNERKHRRLGALASIPTFAGFSGGPRGMSLYGMRTFKPVILPQYSRQLVAAFHFDGDMNLNVAFEIAFCDVPGKQATPTVIATLREFGSVCRAVAALFS